jgi:hypothetical protein
MPDCRSVVAWLAVAWARAIASVTALVSSENIRATATTPTTHGQNRTNRSGCDLHRPAEHT